MASPRATAARRRRLVVSLAAALVLAGGAGAYGMGLVGRKSDANRYRTGTVTTGSVQELLTLAGTVARVNQETATFPADGTVTSLKVSVGQTVKAGDTLATLDTTPLTVAVLEAKASLAQAKQTYNDDYTTAHTSTTSSSTSSSTSSTTKAPTGGSSSSGATAQVAKVMAEVQKALAAERTVCAPVLAAGGSTAPTTPTTPTSPRAAATSATTGKGAAVTAHNSSEPSPSSSDSSAPDESATAGASDDATSSPSATPTSLDSATPTGAGSSPTSTDSSSPSTTSSPSSSSSTTAPTAEQVQACATAVTTLAGAEQKASVALTAAFTALSKAVAASSSSSGSATGSSSGSATGSSSAAKTAAAGASAGGQSASSASARLASDKAGITTAEQNLSLAQDNLAGATLVAPLPGVVGSIGFVAGGTATASTGITVVGSGASTITVSVPLASRSKVAVGQEASVLPAGATTALKGRITSISPLPTSSSSATYPAVIQVEDSPAALTSGALADVSIVVGTSKNALTIPVSALVPSSTTNGVVQVLADAGTVSSVTVTTGAVGGGKVAVLTGLTEGQRVVVADASQALPTNSTQNIGRLTSNNNGGPGGQAPQGGTANRAGGGAAPAGP